MLALWLGGEKLGYYSPNYLDLLRFFLIPLFTALSCISGLPILLRQNYMKALMDYSDNCCIYRHGRVILSHASNMRGR